MRLFFMQGDDPPPGGDLYRKVAPVRMWGPMPEPFQCQSREGALTGQAGDYMAQDGHGGFYPVSAEFHAEHYEAVDPPREPAAKEAT